MPISTIAFEHGVYTTELPTPIIPMTSVTEPVVALGTAPLHLAQNPAPPNTPILCSSLSEFVNQFGWHDDFDKFTLCEVAKCHFTVYNVAPVVFINVLNPTVHAVTTTLEFDGIAGSMKLSLNQPVLLDSVKITSGEGDDLITFAADDFTVTRDGEGALIEINSPDKVIDNNVSVTFRELDPSAVTSQNVIGGVDLTTGANLGLEVLEDVYPKLGVVPGSVIAPKFSTDSAVAQVMASKCNGINGCFKAIAIADLPTSTVRKYTDVTAVKTGNNFVDQRLIVCWPKVTLGGEQYHLSTQLAALMCTVDAARDNIPFKSPSNETLKVDGACLSDGTAIYLGRDLANYINGQGVFTALNFGGWRSWGVYSSAYPVDTDPINFVSVKRMMNWLSNNLILNFFNQIDNPQNRVLVDTVLDSVRIWFNGLAARGAILGGSDIAFLETDNPLSELTQGHMVFRLSVGFAVPAKKVEFVLQFNPELYSSLFES